MKWRTAVASQIVLVCNLTGCTNISGGPESLDAGERDVLPPGFDGCSSIHVASDQCVDQTDGVQHPVVGTTLEGENITISIEEYQTRCGQNICGCRLEREENLILLLQPCEMYPTVIPLCDCQQTLSVVVALSAETKNVMIYRRPDFFGSQAEPELIYSAAIPGN